jgi:hypothetical protein
MPKPVNLDSLRVTAAKFREWEAPYKERGDHNGLWFGATATLIESTIAELELLRAAVEFAHAEGFEWPSDPYGSDEQGADKS